MIDFNAAVALANRRLESMQEYDNELCLILSETINKPYGWFFFYNSKKYLETLDFEESLAGNAPFLVDKSGKIHVTGTAKPIEYYIAEIEKSLDAKDARKLL